MAASLREQSAERERILAVLGWSVCFATGLTAEREGG
jgi:hypothetical protein